MVWKPDSKVRDTHPYLLKQHTLGILQVAHGAPSYHSETIAVLRLLYTETHAAKCLFPQEKGTLRALASARVLENRSSTT